MLQCYFVPNVICITRVRLFSLPNSFHEYFFCTWFVNCKVDFLGFWKSWEITGNKDHISSVTIWTIFMNTFFGNSGVKSSKRRKITIRNCLVSRNSYKRNFTYFRLSVLFWLNVTYNSWEEHHITVNNVMMLNVCIKSTYSWLYSTFR